jgi:hypothetical protein
VLTHLMLHSSCPTAAQGLCQQPAACRVAGMCGQSTIPGVLEREAGGGQTQSMRVPDAVPWPIMPATPASISVTKPSWGLPSLLQALQRLV